MTTLREEIATMLQPRRKAHRTVKATRAAYAVADRIVKVKVIARHVHMTEKEVAESEVT